jgi:hypothetical protein
VSLWNTKVPERVMRHYAQGRTHFVLRVGILSFGVPWAIMMFAMDVFIPRQPTEVKVSFAATLIKYLILALIAGVAFGLIMWRKADAQKTAEKSRRL